MALNRGKELELNDVYRQMVAGRYTCLTEAITSNNSIHEETERLIDELSGDDININSEDLEEKLRDLEKNELTSLDKKVIANIRKNVDAMQKAKDAFELFTKKLKYEYVVSKKNSTRNAEKELEDANTQFEEPAEEPVEDTQDTTNAEYEDVLPVDENIPENGI